MTSFKPNVWYICIVISKTQLEESIIINLLLLLLLLFLFTPVQILTFHLLLSAIRTCLTHTNQLRGDNTSAIT
jgi:hypothetical protein